VQSLRDRSLRLPGVYSALLLFGAAGILAMVVAFSIGGSSGQRPASSPLRLPAATALPSQTAAPSPSLGTPGAAAPSPTPVCVPAGDRHKHQTDAQQICTSATATPDAGGDNGD
jgi:hypothetical protein